MLLVKTEKILGHSAVLNRLFGLTDRGALPHALLFAGPSDIGKFRVARRLAGYALPDFSEKIEKNACPEVVSVGDLWQMDTNEDWGKIAKTSNFSQKHRESDKKKTDSIGVEDVHAFLEPIFRTTDAPAKFVLLRDAERLTIEAANALLKVLEEPPEKTHFILTARHQRSLPETIVSRCQTFSFSLISREILRKFLLGKEVDESLQENLLTIAQGRSEVLFHLLEDADFLEQEQEEFQEIARFFFGKSLPERFKKAEFLAHPERLEIAENFLENMIRFARSLLVEKSAKKSLEIGSQIGFEKILEILEALFSAQKSFLANANRRLVLENLFLTLPQERGGEDAFLFSKKS